MVCARYNLYGKYELKLFNFCGLVEFFLVIYHFDIRRNDGLIIHCGRERIFH